MLGFTVATALTVTIVGALGAAKPVDRFGRKKVLHAIGVLYLIGALGSAPADNLTVFMIFRFLGGVGVGHRADLHRRGWSTIRTTSARAGR